MRAVLPVLALLCLVPGEAAAHLVSTRFGELYSGMLHPLTAPQHLVPWLALGLLAGFQDVRIARWALIAFPAAVCGGVVLADIGAALPQVDTANLVSLVILGLLVVLRVRLPLAAFLGLVGLFGLTHGFANGAPEVSGFGAFLYAVGVTLTAYLLVTLVSAAAQALIEGHGWGQIAVRAVGSWVTAAGLIYGGFVLTAA